MEDVVSSQEEELVILTPGALLEKARLEKGLSQEHVAKKLKHSTQWVKDIESNDYTYAGALIYAQGYLRSYARLVGVSEDAVLEAFRACGFSSQFDKASDERLRIQQSVVVSSAGRPLMHRKGHWVRWVTLAVVLGLVLSVVAWWKGQSQHDRLGSAAAPTLAVEPQNLPLNNASDDEGAASDQSKLLTDSASQANE